ncbi:hypothetical protein D3C72_1132400 [compost metagenome]
MTGSKAFRLGGKRPHRRHFNGKLARRLIHLDGDQAGFKAVPVHWRNDRLQLVRLIARRLPVIIKRHLGKSKLHGLQRQGKKGFRVIRVVIFPAKAKYAGKYNRLRAADFLQG